MHGRAASGCARSDEHDGARHRTPRWWYRRARSAVGARAASEPQSDLTLAPTSNAAAAAHPWMLSMMMRQRQRFLQSRGLATTGLMAHRRSSPGGTSGRTGSNGTASSPNSQTSSTAPATTSTSLTRGGGASAASCPSSTGLTTASCATLPSSTISSGTCNGTRPGCMPSSSLGS